jgi:hypothetical protein
MSPQQYREEYGRDPVPPDRTAEVWPDAAGWPGWHMPWPPPTVIQVMAEWGGTCLWNRSPAHERDRDWDDYMLEPEILGVSRELADRLEAWNARPGPPEEWQAPASWNREGLVLAQTLQREFDSRSITVEVWYRDNDARVVPALDLHPGDA